MAALRKPLSLKALRNKVLSTVFGLVWSPSLLFANNEVGAWYDPSDLSTMYQDSAGTTPVTAVEQPVGLLLDKSKGLALGADALGGAGAFSSAGSWSVGAGWSIGSGVATAASAASMALASVLTIGKWYKITLEVTAFTSGTLYAGTISNLKAMPTGTGTKTAYFLADATTFYLAGLTAFNGTVDNVVVNDIAGNHASQSTAASRPVLSARVNLLTQTEDPTSWSAIGSTVLVKTVTATATTNRHGIISPGTVAPASTACTATVRVTRVNSDFIQLAGSSGGFYANFNISSGVVGTTGGVRVIGSSIALVSAGTYDCTVTFTGNADLLWVILAQTASDGVLPSYLAAGTEAFIYVRADLRVTNVGVNLPAYQRVGAAVSATTNPAVTGVPDYDTSGFPLYLKFDGVDDSLTTGTIDFSATDKMSVFAGVRKLSDAAGGEIVSLGNITSVNGSFELRGPRAAAPNYMFGSRGTSFADANIASGYSAPITNVVTGIADISVDLCALRINGTVVASPTTDQGTGNYSSGVVFVGRLGGTALSFNGNLYSLIVRGALSTDAQIASTETYVNSKTGAY